MPDNAFSKTDAAWMKGNMLKCEGQIDAAIEAYRTAITADSDHARSHFSLGVNLFYEKDSPLEAIQEYQEAIRLMPDYHVAYLNLGIALASVGRYHEGLAQLEELVRRSPGFSSAYCEMGNIYKQLHRTEEAIQAYKSALRTYPQYPEAKLNLALTLNETGQREQSLHLLRELTLKYPIFCEGRLALATLLHESGLNMEACQEWKQILAVADEEDIITEAKKMLAKMC